MYKIPWRPSRRDWIEEVTFKVTSLQLGLCFQPASSFENVSFILVGFFPSVLQSFLSPIFPAPEEGGQVVKQSLATFSVDEVEEKVLNG